MEKKSETVQKSQKDIYNGRKSAGKGLKFQVPGRDSFKTGKTEHHKVNTKNSCLASVRHIKLPLFLK